VTRLNREVIKVLDLPEVRKTLRQEIIEPSCHLEAHYRDAWGKDLGGVGSWAGLDIYVYGAG
jgi:hypothetical protein